MDRPMSNLSFYFMSFFFKFRDFFSSPMIILEQIGIRSGWNVLDYGAGSGSYSISAAKLVGPTGRVYAADIHTLAIGQIQKKASRKGLRNIHTTLTECKTQLLDASVDVVLLFYVLHDFKNPDPILNELNRVLKPGGLLAVIDHKFEKDKVVSVINNAAENLKPSGMGKRNGRRKGELIIFSKEVAEGR
jgi:ubiquinone/menaquinone biosynthesis C-methylase UbiE